MPETTKATATDAELILKLYDLRREQKMRKAREWYGGQFWPESFEEVQQVMMSFDKEENAYLRQVLSYWDMACSLVLHGTLDSNLFFDTNGEGTFVYTKIKPFIPQLRTAFNAPEFCASMEGLFESTPEWRQRISRMETNLAHFREMRKQQISQGKAA